MSLLNDMLRDLDKHRGRGNSSILAPGMAKAVPRNAVKRWWLPAAAVLALGYFFVVERNLLGLMPNPTQNYLEAPKPISMNPKWLAAVENHGQGSVAVQTAVASEPTAAPDNVAAPVASPSVVPESGRVAQAAETRPASDGTNLRASNLDTAAPSDDAFSSAGTHQNVQNLADENAPIARSELASEPKSHRESVGDSPRAGAASAPRVTLSPEDRDHNVAQALNTETLAQRESQAWLWLREGAVIDQTAFALADIYRANGNLRRLQELQEHLAQRAPNLVAYVLAQQALLQQDWPAAIRALGSAQFQGRAEAQRLRLLGGIYQNTQQYPQALDVYRQLVAQSDAQVNDWLGQAVALDALGNRQGARDAYRRVHQMQHPDPQVNAYAQRREHELSQSFLSR